MSRPTPAPGRLEQVALRYAQHGWPVIPLHSPKAGGCSCRQPQCSSPGKHPRTARGVHQASTDPAQVQAWWSRWPTANIAVATGAASGLLVLDVDLPDGPESLNRLQADHGRLPATCQQTTGSGGRQLLFAHPGQAVGNRTGLRPGIDVRGDGGYIVVPPSRHACGEPYLWTGRRPPAAPPAWLLEVLTRAQSRRPPAHPVHVPHGPRPTTTREQRYAAAALDREVAHLAVAVKGTRNDTLNRAAFNLGQLVAAGLLDREHVIGELTQVATDIGLPPGEITRTVTSGLTAGAQHPRTIPPPSREQPGRGPLPPARRLRVRRR